MYRLAGIYNTCIVTILHFIPSGLKLRGHLGSELQRKAAAILSIEKDTDPSVSVVKGAESARRQSVGCAYHAVCMG